MKKIADIFFIELFFFSICQEENIQMMHFIFFLLPHYTYEVLNQKN